ncbi:alpha/beta hydrolase [Rhodophyticola sp. CCM32]|uniref:alpha/beta hydrolase n=1 Tax=Rhodophyticola sp. CCM32 TaxID=2916397 RepID=UPI00143D09B4|nr:alpha/beta hydrolase [Rhodophyticola sp. CCM32]
MPVLPVTARCSQIDAPDALVAALTALPFGSSASFMIHGYRFCPHSPENSPHRHILSPRPDSSCWKAISWPRHLHLDRPGAGLGIGFGWPAMGRLARVANRAFAAGAALAGAIRLTRDTRPDLQINILAHSLGARVALAALPRLDPDDVARMILLSGAEYRSLAARAMAGRRLQVLNVTSGENALFDGLFRTLVPAPQLFDRPLAAGLGQASPRWIDLAIDAGPDRAALTRLGFATRQPVTRVCHWSGYLRPGMFALYRGFFDPGQTALFDRLRMALPAGPSQKRRSSLSRFADIRTRFSGTAQP